MLVKAIETMTKGQYNLNIAAAQQSDEVYKSGPVKTTYMSTNKVEQITEIMVTRKWNLFSAGCLESFFEW